MSEKRWPSEDRDIAEYGEPNAIDAAYIRRKLQLAGTMKTSIKRFLAAVDRGDLECGNCHSFMSSEGVLFKRLREAMENYLNCEEETSG